jgi:hypothetical protein
VITVHPLNAGQLKKKHRKLFLNRGRPKKNGFHTLCEDVEAACGMIPRNDEYSVKSDIEI